MLESGTVLACYTCEKFCLRCSHVFLLRLWCESPIGSRWLEAVPEVELQDAADDLLKDCDSDSLTSLGDSADHIRSTRVLSKEEGDFQRLLDQQSRTRWCGRRSKRGQ